MRGVIRHYFLYYYTLILFYDDIDDIFLYAHIGPFVMLGFLAYFTLVFTFISL